MSPRGLKGLRSLKGLTHLHLPFYLELIDFLVIYFYLQHD